MLIPYVWTCICNLLVDFTCTAKFIFLNITSFVPLTITFFNNFLSVHILTWANLQYHNHPSEVLVNSHVFTLASSKVTSSKYALLYINPLNITSLWSFLDTETMWICIKSHNYPTNNKLKLNDATESTLGIEWSFEIITLPKLWLFSLSCLQRLSSLDHPLHFIVVNIQESPIICCIHPLSIAE